MTIYTPLEHALGIPPVVQSAVLAALLVVAAGYAVRRQIAAANGGTLPDEGLTLRNAFEIIVEGLAGLTRDNIGEDWRRYFPLIGTIFIFILVSNWLNLIPGVEGATISINTTAAWALISVSVAEWAGIRKHGARYVEHFIGPRFGGIPWLAPIFIPLELIGHIARVVTLSIRLLANMFADHTIVAVMLSLVPLVIPSLFMGLGVIVGVLQAFVFALLTMVYVGLAVEEAH